MTKTGSTQLSETIEEVKELLAEPWVIALGLVLLVGVITTVVLALYLARRRWQRAWGPYGPIVKLVLSGHAQGTKENKEAAGDLYRAAFLNLCHKVLSGGSNAKNVTPAPSTVAKEIDEVLHEYNSAVGLGAVLSFAVRNEALAGADTIFPVAFDAEGVGVTLDSACCIAALRESGAAARAGTAIGDRLVSVNGAVVADMKDEVLQAQLAVAGRASFQRPATGSMAVPKQGEGSTEAVFVCSRCGTGNRPSDEPCKFFRCFSCQATAVSWQFLVAEPTSVAPSVASSRRPKWKRKDRVGPDVGHPHLKDLTWESSGLDALVKHPMGFGAPVDAPPGCQHHGQVGPMCGLSAVNNLITNSGKSGVDSEYMLRVSRRLAEAEAVLRDGAQSVQEAGEDVNLAEFYAASSGGHFDVQTLQTALYELGFCMWYMPQQQLQDPQTLFARKEGTSEDELVVGYVVHRKDPLNPRQDHWFIVRKHGKDKDLQFLLQDSLYDQVFRLSRVEAHQLLVNLPVGALFAVSQLSATGEP